MDPFDPPALCLGLDAMRLERKPELHELAVGQGALDDRLVPTFLDRKPQSAVLGAHQGACRFAVEENVFG